MVSLLIMSPKQSLGDILCLLRFLLSSQTKFGNLLFLHRFFFLSLLLLLHHPDCCRVMYCYSTFLFHYSYYYYYYYHSSTHFCPLNFLEMPWSNFMKPCRNIICHVMLCCEGLIFFKMAVVAMETPEMLKNWKTQKWYSPNRNWWNLIGTTSTSSGMR